LYINALKQRKATSAPKFVKETKGCGGSFILLDEKARTVLDDATAEKLVAAGLTGSTAPPESDGAKKAVTAPNEEEDEHPALLLSKEQIAKSAPDYHIIMPDLDGTAFKPELSFQKVKDFIKKANRLSNRTEEALYKLLPELDDAEDAVHLFRNFNDENEVTGSERGKSKTKVVDFSRREVDILAYSVLHTIHADYTWNLMPYRKRSTLAHKLGDKAGMFRGNLEALLEDPDYLKHLNSKVSILFQEAD
jgi:hypothetical protein